MVGGSRCEVVVGLVGVKGVLKWGSRGGRG